MEEPKNQSHGLDLSSEILQHEHRFAEQHIVDVDLLFLNEEHPSNPPPPYIKLPFFNPRTPVAFPSSRAPTAAQRSLQIDFSHKEFQLNPRKYIEEGEYSGDIFTPKDVRNILSASGYFLDEQVKAWRTYIVVPPGVTAFDFIIMKAAREGLTLLGLYTEGKVVPAVDGLSGEELTALNVRNGLRQKTAFAFSRYKFQTPLILITLQQRHCRNET
jgi:hypothetical protein